GVEDGAVEAAVEVEEGVGEALLCRLGVLPGGLAAGAEGLDGVVEGGEGEGGVERLLPLAVGVYGFAEGADALALLLRRVREGEGLEALRLVVAWVVADTEPSSRRKRPLDMDGARQDAKVVTIG